MQIFAHTSVSARHFGLPIQLVPSCVRRKPSQNRQFQICIFHGLFQKEHIKSEGWNQFFALMQIDELMHLMPTNQPEFAWDWFLHIQRPNHLFQYDYHICHIYVQWSMGWSVYNFITCKWSIVHFFVVCVYRSILEPHSWEHAGYTATCKQNGNDEIHPKCQSVWNLGSSAFR